MVNILQSRFCNTMAACLTTIAFTTATLAPPPLMAAGVNLDPNAINFGIKVEKVFEKVKKSIDKGETNKIVGYMFDIRHDVASYRRSYEYVLGRRYASNNRRKWSIVRCDVCKIKTII